MTRLCRCVFTLAMFSLLAACALPRGAALQSEIIRNSDSEAAEFAVYAVDKGFLPIVQDWPGTGGIDKFGWVPRQQGPIGRVILPGDMISLSVWDSDANSLLTSPAEKVANLKEMRVATNGNIFVPYAGAVKVSGATEQQARNRVQEAIVSVSPSAQVQLTSEVGTRHTVSLVSGVNNPGPVPLIERDMTVLSAISAGGGVTTDLANPQVRLLRDNNTYAMSLERLFKSPSLDTTLRSGDKVIVAATEEYFLALGATGQENLIPFPKEEVSALDALSLISGLSDTRANPQGVLILREYGNKSVRTEGDAGPSHKRVVFTMDLTSADGLFSAGKFQVNPKDVVYATESPVTSARTILSLIGAAIGVTNSL
ncbi:MAG: polysaccharide biosynthesis/export family protein [Litoreibacter sp.]